MLDALELKSTKRINSETMLLSFPGVFLGITSYGSHTHATLFFGHA